MTVQDIIDDAKYGELQQLAVINKLSNADPLIVKEAEQHILSYINLGLVELYKRFDLRSEEVIITLSTDQTVYELDPTNVYHAVNNPTGYLNTMFGDVINISAAYNELGDEYPLNDELNPLSVMTPTYNTIQVTNPVQGEQLYIIYNSAPDRIQWTEDLSAVNIPLSASMTEALLHYVGYRGHGSIDGSIQAENNTHYNRFDKSCAKLHALGLITADRYIGGTLQEKGFV